MGAVSRRNEPGRPARWIARWIEEDTGVRRSKTFDRKLAAQRFLATVETSVLAGDYVSPEAGRTSLRTYYDDWSKRQLWVHGSRVNMDTSMKSTTFADLPLGQLRRSHIEAWIKQLDANGLGAGTIKTRFVCVRSVIRAAVRDRILARDPAEGVVLPRRRRNDAAMTLPTTEQVAALLAGADPRFRGFVAVCAFAGLRLGEALGLQVGDVDFLRRQIKVQRQVQKVPGGVEIRLPKYASERTVALPKDVLELLAEHVRVHCPGDDPERWLFGALGKAGGPPDQNVATYRWRETCAAALVPGAKPDPKTGKPARGGTGITAHDLRHFFASALISAGLDVVAVQRALGHATASTTLNIYAHLWPTAEDRTRAAVSGLFDQVLKPVSPQAAPAQAL
ncbi:MAG TPA: tyrosine-type recombinase/integrase [Sporichthyaceae bacterium]|jgi:integrase|nr:tyrosine-type recombinase/integrase [Sporichthyaceae bacterium]